ncbi:MAG: hypothetical protein R2867_40760 [Caldilineaceae bacterium]
MICNWPTPSPAFAGGSYRRHLDLGGVGGYTGTILGALIFECIELDKRFL